MRKHRFQTQPSHPHDVDDLCRYKLLQTPEIAVVDAVLFQMHDRVVEIFGA